MPKRTQNFVCANFHCCQALTDIIKGLSGAIKSLRNLLHTVHITERLTQGHVMCLFLHFFVERSFQTVPASFFLGWTCATCCPSSLVDAYVVVEMLISPHSEHPEVQNSIGGFYQKDTKQLK